MVQYVENIVIPYVAGIQAAIEEDKPALVIMDNFKGQITSAVTELIEEKDIHFYYEYLITRKFPDLRYMNRRHCATI